MVRAVSDFLAARRAPCLFRGRRLSRKRSADDPKRRAVCGADCIRVDPEASADALARSPRLEFRVKMAMVGKSDREPQDCAEAAPPPGRRGQCGRSPHRRIFVLIAEAFEGTGLPL